MAGRRPKPTHLKLVTGNPGRRPLNDAEPLPEVGVPSPPEGMSEAAQAAWARLVPILHSMGVLTVADGLALSRVCETYAEILACKAALDDYGSRTYACETPTGTMYRAYPEVAMLADADRRFKSWMVEFGLTPSARSKVKTNGEAEKADPADAYFGS